MIHQVALQIVCSRFYMIFGGFPDFSNSFVFSVMNTRINKSYYIDGKVRLGQVRGEEGRGGREGERSGGKRRRRRRREQERGGLGLLGPLQGLRLSGPLQGLGLSWPLWGLGGSGPVARGPGGQLPGGPGGL